MIELAKELQPFKEGERLIREAYTKGADVVVGSIIAAQAYANVVAMIPCKGYEQATHAQERMRPDKFTIFNNE